MIRTTELRMHCPDLKTQLDEAEARQALAGSPGLDSVELDHRSGSVRIITSNQDGGIDVQFRLVQAGFPPDEVRRSSLPNGPEPEEQPATS